MYLHMKKLLLGFLLWALMLPALAQQRTISGKVTGAEDGEGLPGVTIMIKGTTNGVTTDFDGKYTLSVISGENRQRRILLVTHVSSASEPVVFSDTAAWVT